MNVQLFKSPAQPYKTSLGIEVDSKIHVNLWNLVFQEDKNFVVNFAINATELEHLAEAIAKYLQDGLYLEGYNKE